MESKRTTCVERTLPEGIGVVLARNACGPAERRSEVELRPTELNSPRERSSGADRSGDTRRALAAEPAIAAGLVDGRKDGRWVYYRLVPATAAPDKHLRKLLVALEVDDVLAKDQERFERRMPLRTDGQCRIGIQTPSLVE